MKKSTAFGEEVIKSEGQCFWILFKSITTAALTAIEIQKDLETEGNSDQNSYFFWRYSSRKWRYSWRGSEACIKYLLNYTFRRKLFFEGCCFGCKFS